MAEPVAPAADTPAASPPARKRAQRKTLPRVTEQVEAQEPAPTLATPAPIPDPEAPARKTTRRPPTRRKTASPVPVTAEVQAMVVQDTPPEPEPEPEPEPIPAPPEPAAEPAPPPDLRPDHSAVTLARGLRHRLHWAAGRHCPPDLDTAAQALNTPTAEAPRVNDLALVELVRVARERRHPLQVSEEVWDWLAQARDLRDRVEHLERRHPAGPLSPALAALVTGTLRPYQAEGALYAACAGRSLLADDTGLGKTVQAIAALRLIGEGFGAGRALVLCPPERLAHWQAQWQQWTGTDPAADPDTLITGLDTLADDLDRLRAFGADVVVVDEPAEASRSPWACPDTPARLRLIASPWALVLARSPLDSRPDTWQAMLDWLDTGHFGAVAACQAGDLDALAPWMLHRTRTLVLRQLPETVEQTTFITLPPDQRAAHDTLLDQMRHRVQRWQRSQFIASTEQRQLLQSLHTLRQCGLELKVAAALQVLDAALQAPEAKVVVFSQWPAHLDALGAALQARGSTFRHLPPELPGEARRALVSEFQQEPGLRVLLCADDERGGSLGLRHAATAVVHLGRPWNPSLLTQRLSRLHRADRIRLVPVHHLVVQAQQAADLREHFVGLVDGPHADVFLEGPRLIRFMSALQALADPAGQAL